MPANGLVYTTPKHCTCWPMLRGFVAMAPASAEKSPATQPLQDIEFPLEPGPAEPDVDAANPQAADWPMYRHDRWRSGSTKSPGPASLKTRWSVDLAGEQDVHRNPAGPIPFDWQDNPVVKGPLSAPTEAGTTESSVRGVS